MKKVIIKKQTVAKLSPFDSKVLKPNEKTNVNQGSELEVVEVIPAPGPYTQLKLKEPLCFGGKYFHLCLFYSEHIELVSDKPEQSQVKLDVPYLPQNDNIYNPTGSCNVTSIAMCLLYLKVSPRTDITQLEDELYSTMIERGLSRHSPNDLAIIVRDYGLRDRFVTNATIEEVQQHLESGYPAVTHGYFTAFGHIITIVGYDENGFIVHDPYGEWFSDGYLRNDFNRKDDKGKYLHYSYNLIRKTCMPDGEFWVHFISNK